MIYNHWNWYTVPVNIHSDHMVFRVQLNSRQYVVLYAPKSSYYPVLSYFVDKKTQWMNSNKSDWIAIYRPELVATWVWYSKFDYPWVETSQPCTTVPTSMFDLCPENVQHNRFTIGHGICYQWSNKPLSEQTLYPLNNHHLQAILHILCESIGPIQNFAAFQSEKERKIVHFLFDAHI